MLSKGQRMAILAALTDMEACERKYLVLSPEYTPSRDDIRWLVGQIVGDTPLAVTIESLLAWADCAIRRDLTQHLAVDICWAYVYSHAKDNTLKDRFCSLFYWQDTSGIDNEIPF